MHKRFVELDGLRAFAIVAVLGCHYGGFARQLHGLPEFGWMGVDVFFVLSGYLITNILLKLRTSEHAYKTFYARRTIRILPPYLLALAAAFALSPGLLHLRLLLTQLLFLQALPGYAISLIHNVVKGTAHFPSLLNGAHSLPLNVEGLEPAAGASFGTYWSLSIEEYFYLFWAPVVLALRNRAVLMVALLVCIADPLMRWLNNSSVGYFSLFFRFDALVYGALLAMLLTHVHGLEGIRRLRQTFLIVFAIAVCGIAAVLWSVRPVLQHEIRASPLVLVLFLPLFSVATATLLGHLVLSANSSSWFSQMLRSRPAQFIGTISYSMYLYHMIIALVVVRYITTHYVAPIATVLTILAAWASWHWLEAPLLHWKDRRFPSRAQAVALPTQ